MTRPGGFFVTEGAGSDAPPLGLIDATLPFWGREDHASQLIELAWQATAVYLAVIPIGLRIPWRSKSVRSRCRARH